MIDGNTALLGILGNPLSRARTPRMVNEALKRMDENAVLVPWLVSPDGLPGVVAGLRHVHNFRGAVITMPHKEAVVSLLDEVTPRARQVGACNVIRRSAGGRLAGDVFDGVAAVAALSRAGQHLLGRHVVLAGAGGAAAAIAFALAEQGIGRLTVYNRTTSAADRLVERLHQVHPNLDITLASEPPAPTGTEIAINATSLGMGADDPAPFGVSALTATTVVFDIVMNNDTALSAAARAHRCPYLTGENMLAEQVQLLVDYMLESGVTAGVG